MGRGVRRGRPVASLRVIAIGRAASGTPEQILFDRYARRLRPPLLLRELPDGGDEGASLFRAVAPREFAVALDRRGDMLDSATLARRVERWLAEHGTIAFLVGGADGFSTAVLARAGAVLSFGPPTWPHMLARAMLAEQLWRARAISAGHPYHRE